MNISEYVNLLLELQKEHGDLDVQTSRYDGARVTAQPPMIDYEKILKGRERKPDWWGMWNHENYRGNKVVRI